MSRSRALRINRIAPALASQTRRVMSFIQEATPAAMLALLLAMAWLLGGATRSNTPLLAMLEIGALVCLSLVLLVRSPKPLLAGARWPAFMVAAFLGVVGLQLVPLPWDLWRILPGHEEGAAGLALLGLGGDFRPVSLTPESTISGLLKIIPPAAVFVIAVMTPWRMLMATLLWAVLALAVASTLWGLAQAVAGVGHIYSWTHFSMASGTFANPNHQATLLLMCLPLIAVLAGQARHMSEDPDRGGELALVWLSAGGFVFLGVVAAGSLFGFLFAPFVIATSTMISASSLRRPSWRMLGIGLALSMLALALVIWNSGLDQLGSGDDGDSPRSRSSIYTNTIEAITDYVPLGSGLGSFEKVYPLYEDDSQVSTSYVNHAHNEVLQVTLELGIPGAIILAVFVIWFAAQAGGAWFRPRDFGSLLRLKMAACVSVSVPLIHSLIDYPLRSPAVACLAAACIGALVKVREMPVADEPADAVAGEVLVEEVVADDVVADHADQSTPDSGQVA